MSEWTQTNLGLVTDIISVKVDIKNATLENYVSTDNMLMNFGGVINAEKLPNIAKVNSFKKDDILFSNIRTYFKKVWRCSFSGTVSPDVLVFRPKDDRLIDNRYLYYLLCNPEFTDYSVLTSRGAKMPRGDKDALQLYRFLLPPLPEQKTIAGVLSSLDDKIDLLHRQNKTLEAMAETLFRQWFIEEAEDDWEEVKLSDISVIKIGRTPPRKEQEWFSTDSDDIKWISIKDLGEHGVYIFNTAERLTKKAVERFSIPRIPPNSVVLSFKMTVGRVSITSEEMLSNEAIAQFQLKEESGVSSEFLYLFLKQYKYDSLGSTSSIVTAINSTMIRDIDINIPCLSKLTNFDELVTPVFRKIRENQTQIYHLQEVRDVLLPKLLAGEVRVEYE